MAKLEESLELREVNQQSHDCKKWLRLKAEATNNKAHLEQLKMNLRKKRERVREHFRDMIEIKGEIEAIQIVMKEQASDAAELERLEKLVSSSGQKSTGGPRTGTSQGADCAYICGRDARRKVSKEKVTTMKMKGRTTTMRYVPDLRNCSDEPRGLESELNAHPDEVERKHSPIVLPSQPFSLPPRAQPVVITTQSARARGLPRDHIMRPYSEAFHESSSAAMKTERLCPFPAEGGAFLILKKKN